MQGALFVAITAGTDLAKDIETGFFDRLALTPLRSAALLIGQLGGALVVACIQSVLYLLVGIASGVGIKTGVLGAIVLLVLSTVIAFGFGSLGVLAALRFGSGEAVQAPTVRTAPSERLLGPDDVANGVVQIRKPPPDHRQSRTVGSRH